MPPRGDASTAPKKPVGCKATAHTWKYFTPFFACWKLQEFAKGLYRTQSGHWMYLWESENSKSDSISRLLTC